MAQEYCPGYRPHQWARLQGISNIENYLCNLKGIVGENSDLQSAIAAQCANLDTEDQLNNPGNQMDALTGWTAGGPLTLAASLMFPVK